MVKICLICDKLEVIPNTEHKNGTQYGVCSEKCLDTYRKRSQKDVENYEKYFYHPVKLIFRDARGRSHVPPATHFARSVTYEN